MTMTCPNCNRPRLRPCRTQKGETMIEDEIKERVSAVIEKSEAFARSCGLSLSMAAVKLAAADVRALLALLDEREAEIAALRQGWISVEDGLPEPEVDVLVWVVDERDGDALQAIDCYDPVSYVNSWLVYRHRVTHWQPLPEPPEE